MDALQVFLMVLHLRVFANVTFQASFFDRPDTPWGTLWTSLTPTWQTPLGPSREALGPPPERQLAAPAPNVPPGGATDTLDGLGTSLGIILTPNCIHVDSIWAAFGLKLEGRVTAFPSLSTSKSTI